MYTENYRESKAFVDELITSVWDVSREFYKGTASVEDVKRELRADKHLFIMKTWNLLSKSKKSSPKFRFWKVAPRVAITGLVIGVFMIFVFPFVYSFSLFLS